MANGTGGFQQQVGGPSAPAVEGDFASLNPWFSFDAGPGGLVAGAEGLYIGRFAWVYPPVDPNGTRKVARNIGNGPVAGFVHRTLEGSITEYLAFAGLRILPGQQSTLMVGGDFWVRNAGAAAAQVGQKAYANYADGKASFGATGSPASIATSTSSTISAQTAQVVGSILGDVLTVTAVNSGSLVAGAVLSGTGGGGVASGTQIVSQISGTPGGVGTYYVTPPNQAVTSTTIDATYGLLTVGGSITGSFGLGDVVTGTGVTAGTRITQLGTGAGQAGTYYVSPTQAMSASAVGATGNVETKWYAMSAGAVGELIKISDHPTG